MFAQLNTLAGTYVQTPTINIFVSHKKMHCKEEPHQPPKNPCHHVHCRATRRWGIENWEQQSSNRRADKTQSTLSMLTQSTPTPLDDRQMGSMPRKTNIPPKDIDEDIDRSPSCHAWKCHQWIKCTKWISHQQNQYHQRQQSWKYQEQEHQRPQHWYRQDVAIDAIMIAAPNDKFL